MFDMIQTINRFYEKEGGPGQRKPGRLVVVFTVDSSVKTMTDAGRLGYMAACLGAGAFNIVEHVKAGIKGRAAAYRMVKVTDVAFRGSAYLNFNNGTVVIMRETCVDKFYFKDSLYFASLYDSVSGLAGMEVLPAEGTLVVRQSRHRCINGRCKEAELLASTRSLLERLHGLLDRVAGRKDLYSVEYKVRQLFEFYLAKNRSEHSGYLDIARGVDEKSSSFKKVLCHGDLWRENILEDGESGVALIDFDKAVEFCQAYDYVYFYLMSRVLNSRIEPSRILIDIDKLADGASDFLHSECKGDLGRFDRMEIKLCIFLIAFLKLVERDLRHNECGRSLTMLRKTLAAL